MRDTFASTSLNSGTCFGRCKLMQARSRQLHLHAQYMYLPDITLFSGLVNVHANRTNGD